MVHIVQIVKVRSWSAPTLEGALQISAAVSGADMLLKSLNVFACCNSEQLGSWKLRARSHFCPAGEKAGLVCSHTGRGFATHSSSARRRLAYKARAQTASAVQGNVAATRR